jgi:hypothetical protein
VSSNYHGIQASEETNLGGDEFNNADVTRLDEFGGHFDALTRSTIDLLDQLRELASNVGGVAIKNGRIAGTDLARVVKNDDLSVEGSGLFSRVVLGIRSHVPTTDILDGDVPVGIT